MIENETLMHKKLHEKQEKRGLLVGICIFGQIFCIQNTQTHVRVNNEL